MIAGSVLDHGGHSLLVEMLECLNVFLLVVGLCLSRSTSLDDRTCWTALFHLKVSSVFMLFLENDRNANNLLSLLKKKILKYFSQPPYEWDPFLSSRKHDLEWLTKQVLYILLLSYIHQCVHLLVFKSQTQEYN